MEKNQEVKNVTFKDLFLNAEGGFIPMPRQLSRVLGFNATGLLEELYDRYDYYISKDLLNDYGEFYYTVADVEVNIGLSRREQNTAIEKLKKYKFINQPIARGMPKIRYFKMADNPVELINKIYIEAEEIKKDIRDKASNEAERAERYKKRTNALSSTVGTKEPYLNVQKSRTSACETSVLERAKQPVINNYDKELSKTKTITNSENESGVDFTEYMHPEDVEDISNISRDPFNIAKDNLKNVTFNYEAKSKEIVIPIRGDTSDYKDLGYDDGLDF